ncbi:MAG: TIGR04282 family arsenosugar biosynthesis glycosyltransferase [Alphaproteobacteria bacterium]
MSETTLHVFARAPVSGQAKTRLIPALGAQGAAELHARLVRHTLESALSADTGPVTLWCAPDIHHPFFEQCAHEFGITLKAQQGDDLGQRMAHALAFGMRDSKCALLIGTDCPTLDPVVLRSATDALKKDAAVVFVPAEDGGYALIGVSERAPAIFDGIAWGSDTVMAHTRILLRSQSLDWHELPPLADIDTPNDLPRLHHTHPDLLTGLINLEMTP